jgi:hypothetical protein
MNLSRNYYAFAIPLSSAGNPIGNEPSLFPDQSGFRHEPAVNTRLLNSQLDDL